MAVLDEASRIDIWARLMRRLSEIQVPVAITKTELRAAIDATDQWIDDNQVSYNSALAAPAQALPTKVKVLLFVWVALKRYEVI